MKNKFTHTRVALNDYDHTEYIREWLRDKAMTNEDVAVWQAACNAAIEEVQQAFYEDTKPTNSRDHCRYATLSWIRSLL